MRKVLDICDICVVIFVYVSAISIVIPRGRFSTRKGFCLVVEAFGFTVFQLKSKSISQSPVRFLSKNNSNHHGATSTTSFLYT